MKATPRVWTGRVLTGLYLGLITWGGLWLRDQRLSAVFPLLRG